MGRDKNVLIRTSIAHAQKNETQSGSLSTYVEHRLPLLHRAIVLPGDGGSDTLTHFLTRYIEHVPDFLEALIAVSRSAEIFEFVEPIVEVAQNFFNAQTELLDEDQGLQALIDEAYLAHRLMEEVNDRIMMIGGVPLIPMDMTLSNIIVHHLLGDDYANDLDMAVHYAVDELFTAQELQANAALKRYLALHRAEGWRAMIEEWPCLAGDSSISLELEYRPDPATFH